MEGHLLDKHHAHDDIQGEALEPQTDNATAIAVHPHIGELAKRIAIAVGSVNAGVSYATQEKRMEDEPIDSSWLVVAKKLHLATRTAVSERLLGLFDDGRDN